MSAQANQPPATVGNDGTALSSAPEGSAATAAAAAGAQAPGGPGDHASAPSAAEAPQAQAGPGAAEGTAAGAPQGGQAEGGPTRKLSFKEEVGAHAKRFAGKVFGKEHEVKAGEDRLAGVS